MLPDNDELKELLAASTPGPWQKVVAEHTMLSDDTTSPFDVIGADGKIIANNAAFYPEAVSPGDAELIALAPELAAEVIALRERLATVEGEKAETEARMVIYCLACGDVGSSDEEDAFKFVEDNLKAAGWELVGGAE